LQRNAKKKKKKKKWKCKSRFSYDTNGNGYKEKKKTMKEYGSREGKRERPHQKSHTSVAGKASKHGTEKSIYSSRDDGLRHSHGALLFAQFLLFTLLAMLLQMLLKEQRCTPTDLGTSQQRTRQS